MNLTRICLIAMVLAATPAIAQDDGDADAPFDDALRDFGYSGGAAWQCAEGADKGALVEDAMHVYNRLMQLFGSDRAFFFSAAFGAGAVDDIDRGDCERYATEFAEGLTQGQKESVR